MPTFDYRKDKKKPQPETEPQPETKSQSQTIPSAIYRETLRKPTSCEEGRHSWNKWEEQKIVSIYGEDKDMPSSQVMIMKRTCSECGWLQYKRSPI